jgi:ribosome maturation factor RimP
MEMDRRLFELCEPVLMEVGFELVWVQITGAESARCRTAIYIDKDGGVDVDDCATASRLLDPLIDESGLFKSAFLLEVSSPGLDRPLFKSGDFDKYAGSRAKVALKQPLEGKRRNFRGILGGLEDGCVLLKTDEGESYRLPLEDIHRANLVHDWK